jgi:hypothetical protein
MRTLIDFNCFKRKFENNLKLTLEVSNVLKTKFVVIIQKYLHTD